MTDPTDDLPDDVLAALRAPVPVDPGVRDAHLRAALERYDSLDLPDRTGADESEGGGPEAEVVTLRRRPGRWLAVAAGLLLVAGTVAVLAHRSQPGGVQTADRADTVERSTAAASSGARSPAGNPATGSTAAGSTASADASQPLADQPAAGAPGAYGASNAPSATGATTAPAGPSLREMAPATVAPTMCHAPRLRAAFVSSELRTVGGVERLVDTYAWGPDGRLRISVTLDPQTCARS